MEFCWQYKTEQLSLVLKITNFKIATNQSLNQKSRCVYIGALLFYTGQGAVSPLFRL
jgi:hypothetical protein